MKKVIRFFKHNRKAIFKSVLLAMVAVIVFEIAHNYATMEREYVAYGGEIFIPFIIIFGCAFKKKIWAFIKEPFEVLCNEY